MTPNKCWPLVPLGEILTERREFPSRYEIESGRIRVIEKIGFREGRILLRTTGETNTKMILIRPGDLVVSGINAAKGAIAICDGEFRHPIAATIHYGSYIPDSSRITVRFLWWMLRSRFFQDILNEYVPGGIKTELKAKRLLPVPIPLPPMDQQRQIVAKIERLSARISEARSLRASSVDGCDQLCRALLRDERWGSPTPTSMGELVSWRKPHVSVVATDTYDFAGVYCFGRGVFRGQRRTGTEFAYKQLTQIRAGEFIYPKLMAWEGALAVIPEECDGLFVSPEFPVFTINEDRVLPEVLDVYFRSPSVWPSLSGASTGTNVRRKRLNPSDFLNYQFPVPTRKAQLAVRAVRSRMNELRPLQQQEAQLDALLPSILDRAFKGEL